ncbi:MAG: hypothetical protein A4E32_00871 [Methanomassiliicoccales archaeon PtaU1.Bin124]|nr:MAG: hypothetical protein A4E32_00871 [Methanomassiliicoccales archaeon PtaU1.Bin124]
MAQKKVKEPQKKEARKKSEESFEWTPPDFNEREFLEKDIRGTKILMVSAMMSVICGAVAFAFQSVSWIIGLVVILAGMISLRYLYPMFKLDLKDIDKKTWAANLFMFFLLSLGIWIMLLNPPFS